MNGTGGGISGLWKKEISTDMYRTETKIRVRYGEADPMGVLYYGYYSLYYEVGRAEMLRELGYSYAALEKEGIMMPVVSLKCKYLKPAHYDDLLTVVTILKEFPKGTSMTFYTEIYNEQGELLNLGETTLVMVRADTMQPVKAPEILLKLFRPYFKDISE